jgi:uncharacterized lipoprotein YajG
MKKMILAVAATGLLSLAACSKSPEAQAVANNAEMMQDALDNAADNLEAMADDTSNTAAAASMENQAEALKQASENVGDAADAKIDNMN